MTGYYLSFWDHLYSYFFIILLGILCLVHVLFHVLGSIGQFQMKTTCSKSFLRLLFILSLDLKFNASEPRSEFQYQDSRQGSRNGSTHGVPCLVNYLLHYGCILVFF